MEENKEIVKIMKRLGFKEGDSISVDAIKKMASEAYKKGWDDTFEKIEKNMFKTK